MQLKRRASSVPPRPGVQGFKPHFSLFCVFVCVCVCVFVSLCVCVCVSVLFIAPLLGASFVEACLLETPCSLCVAVPEAHV